MRYRHDDVPSGLAVKVLAVAGVTAVVAAGALGIVQGLHTRAEEYAAAAPEAGRYTVDVRTDGGQAAINQCNGAVDVTAVYKVHTIAEHDQCGGSDFPKIPGATVRVTGLDAGTYRVDGIIAHLNGLKDTSADIPRGYDLVFQTCNTGYTDMTFTGLTKIR